MTKNYETKNGKLLIMQILKQYQNARKLEIKVLPHKAECLI